MITIEVGIGRGRAFPSLEPRGFICRPLAAECTKRNCSARWMLVWKTRQTLGVEGMEERVVC